ncbi:MAG TPA: hypothetical protein VNF73_08255 [Candidatus Saccharimonadales bacterium]|nr:hypothetical protein [Candidatus Saccharimonadales bacterium]
MTHQPRDASGLAARYEIRVRGELGTAWSDWFAGPVVADRDGGETLMTGDLDQAALHAVLRRIRDLGLPLVSMRRIEPDRAAPKESIGSLEDEA